MRTDRETREWVNRVCLELWLQAARALGYFELLEWTRADEAAFYAPTKAPPDA